MSKYYGPDSNDYRSYTAWLIFAFVFLAVAVILAFAFGWLAVPADTMSAENVRRLSQQANDSYQSLISARSNIDLIEARAQDMVVTYGEDRSTWPQGKADEYLQLRQQLQNQITAYNQSCGEYIALWQDEWRALPAPGDLPKTCERYTQQ